MSLQRRREAKRPQDIYISTDKVRDTTLQTFITARKVASDSPVPRRHATALIQELGLRLDFAAMR